MLQDTGMQLLFYMNNMWSMADWTIDENYAPAVRGASDLLAEYLAGAVNGEHVRSENDIQRSLYAYVAMAEKRCHPVYVDRKTSFRFHIQNMKHYKMLEEYNPMLFCMNDSEYATDDDRRKVTEFLKRRFPDKSEFEK